MAGLSETPCRERIQKLEDDKVIQKRVAVLDPDKLNASVTVFTSVTLDQHTDAKVLHFVDTVTEFPEITEIYCVSGRVDYLLKLDVPDIEAYDRFYKKLISAVDLEEVSSRFVVERIKKSHRRTAAVCLTGPKNRAQSLENYCNAVKF